jgi:hypothetical protein
MEPGDAGTAEPHVKLTEDLADIIFAQHCRRVLATRLCPALTDLGGTLSIELGVTNILAVVTPIEVLGVIVLRAVVVMKDHGALKRGRANESLGNQTMDELLAAPTVRPGENDIKMAAVRLSRSQDMIGWPTAHAFTTANTPYAANVVILISGNLFPDFRQAFFSGGAFDLRIHAATS